MEQRLALIDKVSIPQYAEGSPLILEACALYLDNASGQYIAQLKWKNISGQTIKAVMIDLACSDAFGHDVKTITYQYDRFDVARGQSGGGRTAIPMGIEKIARYEVSLKAVSWVDGTVKEYFIPLTYVKLPEEQACSLGYDLLVQFKRDLAQQDIKTSVRVDVQSAAGLWQCVCGSWQAEGEACLVCGTQKGDLLATGNQEILEQHLAEYNAEQERLKEELRIAREREEAERRRQAEEEERRREQKRLEDEARAAAARKKRNKIISIVLSSAAALTAVVCSLVFYFIPNAKYNAAMTLKNDGWYDAAIVAFQEIETYRDSAAQIEACNTGILDDKYDAAVVLTDEGKYSEAVTIFKELGTYRDADKRITYCSIRQEEDKVAETTKQDDLIAVAKIYQAMGNIFDCPARAAELTNRAIDIVAARYAEVDKLIADGKCAEAEKILAAFGTYGNGQVQAKYYSVAEKYSADAKWNAAEAAFKKAGTYSDAAKRVTYCGIRKLEDDLANTTKQDSLISVANSYAAMGDYLDCADRAKALTDRADEMVAARYAEVDKLIAEGKCAPAKTILAAFGTYGNERVQEKYYAVAEKYLADGKWAEASAAFKKAGSYNDAVKSITYCSIRQEEDKLGMTTSQDSVIAVAKKYAALGTLRDCPDRAKALTDRADSIVTARYAEVDKLIADGKYAEAEKILAAFGTYGNEQVQAKYYAIAENYLASKKYVEAYELFMTINTYKDSESRAKSFYTEYLQDTFGRAKIGSYITFGAYEQDGKTDNGKEPIEWLVLTEENGRLLVISKYVLDTQPYNTSRSTVKWENCTLRTWLNNDFLNSAFISAEKAMIPTVTVSAHMNPKYSKKPYNIMPGNDTLDRVFLLSIVEINKYLVNKRTRVCQWTAYAYAKNEGLNAKNSLSFTSDCWWLRTPGWQTVNAAQVENNDGEVSMGGMFVDIDDCGVRPALWISLTSETNSNSKNTAVAATSSNAYGSTTQKAEDTQSSGSVQMKNASVGDYITFGTYEQDGNTANGKEDIEWLVLEKQDNRALVISRYALDTKPYNEKIASVTWETCTLRKWLNDDFLKAAFSSMEQAMIPAVSVSADKNPSYSTKSGNATQDKVFLLSIPEAKKYFTSYGARQCKPTAYAERKGAYTNNRGFCWWWLRSPGSDQHRAADVDYGGTVYASGSTLDSDSNAVRPALWINLGQ